MKESTKKVFKIIGEVLLLIVALPFLLFFNSDIQRDAYEFWAWVFGGIKDVIFWIGGLFT